MGAVLKAAVPVITDRFPTKAANEFVRCSPHRRPGPPWWAPGGLPTRRRVTAGSDSSVAGRGRVVAR
jgi:hypothetical protein